MRYFYIFLFLVLSISIASCGDSGKDALPESPQGKIAGMAFDGRIIDGVVTAYDYSSGNVGEIVGRTNTDFAGLYQLELIVTARPVLIVITGGRYIEEYTGKNVQLNTTLGHQLRAVVNYSPSTTVNVSISYFTNLAAAYTQYLIDNGEDVKSAVNLANGLFSALVNLDILATQPLDITDAVNSTSFMENGHEYGFYTSAISAWTAKASVTNNSPPHTTFSSINFARVAYEDLHADGFLNGIGYNASVLTFGIIPITSDTYRHELAVSILEMALSPRNKTSLDDANLLPIALRFNDIDHVIYENSSTVQLDEGGALATNIVPNGVPGVIGVDDNKWFKDAFTLSADVSGNVRITKIEFLIDDIFYAGATDLVAPSVVVDTTVFKSTEHKVAIQATNIMGTVTESFVTLGFDNTPPCGTGTRLVCDRNDDCYYEGIWADHGIGKIKSVSWSGLGISHGDNGDGTGTLTSGYKLKNFFKYATSSSIYIQDVMGNSRNYQANSSTSNAPIANCMAVNP